MVTKILIFVKHMDGGTGTFVEQLVKLERMPLGHMSVGVVALEKPQYRTMPSKTSRVNYFSKKQLPPYQGIYAPRAFIQVLREALWLKRNIHRYKPDVILAIDNHCNVLACLCVLAFFMLRKPKLILTIHNNISAVVFPKLSSWERLLFKRICYLLFMLSNVIVCVSHGLASDAKSFFNLKKTPQVIHYGVDRNMIQTNARQAVDINDEPIFRAKSIHLLSVGRFAPQKDFITLIEAFALLHKVVPNTDLSIIGDGPEKKLLIDSITRHGLAKSAYVLGWKQNVYPYIKAADIFVLSSNFEGFPYVLLEAAALSKPIVATDTPYGPRELLGNNTYGLVVPMKSPQRLAQSLIALTNVNMRMKYQVLIEKRMNNFSEHLMISRYATLIHTLIS
jgi:glycosyltransferase involved in cell wall biosynthesis